MNTIIGNNIDEAKSFLERGETVAIPTETVYGLAGNALDANAVLKIFEAKNRPHFDPLIVHVHSINEIGKYVTQLPERALLLFEKFSPGPLTVLLPKNNSIPDLVTSGLQQVAIRIPNHPLALQLLQKLNFPLAAPSANPFGYISPTTAQHVYNQLQGKIPYILDGGNTNVGVESTIIGFEGGQSVVYRLGGLAIEEIENVIGKVQLQINESSNPIAPGSLKSHYAPRKKMIVVEGEHPEQNFSGKSVGVIAFNKYLSGVNNQAQILLSAKGDVTEAAKNLFAAMRQLDESDVDVIVAIKFPEQGLGRAINDRLRRAAAI